MTSIINARNARRRGNAFVRYVALFAALVAFAAPEPNWADARSNREPVARSEVGELERRLLVEESLALTPAEAAKFWPVYDRYQRDLAAWREKRAAIAAEFGESFDSMTDEAAMKLTLDRLELEEDRSRLMRKYLPKFRRVLPAKKLARYYDIEARIRATVAAEIAEELPLTR